MKNKAELIGKFLISYLPKNNGVEIYNIEKIDKYTDIHESSENRFGPKFEIENTLNDVIDFVYQQKMYKSKADAADLVNEFLN